MPRIQEYTRQQSIPSGAASAPMNPSVAGAIGEATSQLGESISRAGSVIFQVQERQRKEDLNNLAIDLKNKIDNDFIDTEVQEKSRIGTDAYGGQVRAKEWGTKAQSTYLKPEDPPELQDAIKQHINARTIALRSTSATHEAGQRNVVRDQILKGSLDFSIKAAALGSLDLDQNIQAYSDDVNIQFMSQEEKDNEIAHGRSAIAEAALQGTINQSAAGALEQIKSGKYDSYLDKNRLEVFSNKAKAIIKAEEADKKTALIEETRMKKEQLELIRQDTNKNLIDLEVAGKLTRKDVAKARNILNENEYRQWYDRIDAREEKMKKAATGDGDFKTDKKLDGKFYRRIVLDTESVTDTEILDSIGAGLSHSSAKSLIDERARRIKGEVDPVRKVGEQIVVKNLERDFNAGLFGDKTSIEAKQELAKHTESFIRWSKSNKDADPSEYYEKLTEPNKTTFIQNVLDNIPIAGRFYDPKTPDLKKRREELAGKSQSEELPDAAKYTGKIIKDTITGKRLKSDGKKWNEVK